MASTLLAMASTLVASLLLDHEDSVKRDVNRFERLSYPQNRSGGDLPLGSDHVHLRAPG